MFAAPLWIVDNISENRRTSLAEPFEFTTLIQRMRSEVRNVCYKKDKGSHEAKGSWRPIIWFDVEDEMFDHFFNSPYGYRGHFLIDAAAGHEANSQVLVALATALVQEAALIPSLAEHVQRSLVSPLAKIWIEEDQHTPATPELIIQVLVPGWVAAATAVHERRARKDPTLTNGSKTLLKRLGVSNGFPVFLSVSGS